MICKARLYWNNGGCGDPECCGEYAAFELECVLPKGHDGLHETSLQFTTEQDGNIYAKAKWEQKQ